MLSREGKGRVALLLSDQIWLWARGYDGGGPHVDLDAASGALADEGAGSRRGGAARSAHGREVSVERQTPEGARPAPVMATAPSGAREEIALAQGEPGLWRAHFDAKEMGLWRFESDGLTALVNVGPANPREFREVASTTEKLRPLAEATGGTVRRLSNGDADTVSMPRVVEMRDANRYGGADWIGIRADRRVDAGRRRSRAAGSWAMGDAGAARRAWSRRGRGRGGENRPARMIETRSAFID